MKRIFSVFSRFGHWAVGVVSKADAERLEAGLKVIVPYYAKGLEVVQTIAALTPDRTDDQIVAVLQRFASPVVLGSTQDRTTLLRDVALQALRKQFPAAPDRQLNRAIEVALGAVKP